MIKKSKLRELKKNNEPIDITYDNPTMKPFGVRKISRKDKFVIAGFEAEMAISRGVFNCWKQDFNNFVVKNDLEDFFYVKYDQSVRGGVGIEINTMPFKMAWIRKNEHVVNKTFDWLRRYKCDKIKGVKVNQSCGFHIHVNKSNLSKEHIDKLLNFFYNPLHNNTYVLKNISKRVKGGGLKKYAELEPEHYTEVNIQKHLALNISGDKTIEFRLFQGTLDKKSIWKYLDFVEALLLYTRSCKYTDLGFDKFHVWAARKGYRISK